MPNTDLNDLIGKRVREMRLHAGLSVETLSKRCTDAGLALSPTAIYLIEGGGRGADRSRRRRRITVDELMTLAYALEISPLVLLLPELDGDYPVSGNVTALAATVYDWMVGGRLAPSTDNARVPSEERVEAWSRFVRPLLYVRAKSGSHEFQDRVEIMSEQFDRLTKFMIERTGEPHTDLQVKFMTEGFDQAVQASETEGGQARGKSEDQTD